MAPPLDSSRDKEPFRGRWKFVINTVAETEGTALGPLVTISSCTRLAACRMLPPIVSEMLKTPARDRSDFFAY